MTMKSRFESARRLVAITVGLCLTATPAIAGIADGPLPVLVAGKTTFHIYSVPGVMRAGAFEANGVSPRNKK